MSRLTLSHWRIPIAIGLVAALLPLSVQAAEGEITEAERDHWAFQPIERPELPATTTAVATTIDAFISGRLEEAGLGLSAPTDRRTLIRRVKFDLLGLPPTPEEVEQFVAGDAPGAYERLVDRYLADPRYGERWGRHWLDLVRFAETDGYNADKPRPLAYRYRDYVIRAFNANLPYDRFVREQIAGDELYPGSESALVATGYLRLWPDESNASDVHKARQDALNDITNNVGSVFLGLTIGCAQCHDHKFDPILQADYYQLQAYFAAIDLKDRVPVADANELDAYFTVLAAWNEESEAVRVELYELEAEARRKAGAEKRLKFPADVLEAVDTRPEERTTKQRQLVFWADRQIDEVAKPERIEKQYSETELKRLSELREQLASLEKSKPAAPRTVDAMATVDSPAGPADSYLLLGGAYDAEFDEVTPQGLTVLQPVSTAAESVSVPRPRSSGRRAALADWLVDPTNPLPARVMVNRIWQGHFGQGLVSVANDFGVQTPEPTHPALLDWLAAEFIESGWDVKHLHRLIVQSATYQQASAMAEADEKALAVDPDNALLWHFPRRRLEAEAIRDELLFVAGTLDHEMYGPGIRPELPEGFSAGTWKASDSKQERKRRSIYVYAKRNLPLPFLAAFDLPDMHESCGGRVTTTTAPQALTLLNDSHVLEAARNVAARLIAEEDSLDPVGLVERAFETTLGRSPTDDEAAAAIEFLNQQEGRSSDVESPRVAAVTDLCHALLNANEFLYVE